MWSDFRGRNTLFSCILSLIEWYYSCMALFLHVVRLQRSITYFLALSCHWCGQTSEVATFFLASSCHWCGQTSEVATFYLALSCHWCGQTLEVATIYLALSCHWSGQTSEVATIYLALSCNWLMLSDFRGSNTFFSCILSLIDWWYTFVHCYFSMPC
jgi:hypothetical protein